MKRWLAFVLALLIPWLVSQAVCNADPPKISTDNGDPSAKELLEMIEKMWAPRNLPFNSTVKILKKNLDGTVLILAKPRFWQSELGCMMLMNQRGNTFSNVFTLVTFAIDGVSFDSIWSSRLSAAPFELSPEKTYQILLQLEDRNEYGKWAHILKMWDGQKLLLDRTKNKKPAKKK
jgi:hypothetical protein